MQKLNRILIVEDTPELREDLALELRDAGYEVIEASEGQSALAFVEKSRPDLVICDIQLPDIDGIAVLTAIRESEGPFKGTPAIIVSAFSDSDMRRQAEIIGIERFIVKPIDFGELLNSIRIVLGNA